MVVAEMEGCPPPPGRGASLWFAISVVFNLGDKGSASPTLNHSCPDVQFIENNITQTLNLTVARMVLGWTVVCLGNFHIPVK